MKLTCLVHSRCLVTSRLDLSSLSPPPIERNVLGFSWVSSDSFPTIGVVIHHLSVLSGAWLFGEAPGPEVLSVCPHPHWTRISGGPFGLLWSKSFIGQFNFPGSWETHTCCLSFPPPRQSSPELYIPTHHPHPIVLCPWEKNMNSPHQHLTLA